MLLHEESQFDHAEKMFERVSRFTRVLQSWLIASRRHDNEGGMDVNMIQNLDAAQIISQIFDMDVTRASNAWHLGKLDQCHNLLGGVCLPPSLPPHHEYKYNKHCMILNS